MPLSAITGMSFSVRARSNPHPSDEEIVDALGGNICRCTGYQSIVKSVHSAAAKMEGVRIAGAAQKG